MTNHQNRVVLFRRSRKSDGSGAISCSGRFQLGSIPLRLRGRSRRLVFRRLAAILALPLTLACQLEPIATVSPAESVATDHPATISQQTAAPWLWNSGIKLAHNLDSASTSNIDQIHPAGSSGYDLTGEGILLGQWDDGSVRDTHIDLVGRVSNRDNGGISDHSTLVAGTLIGDGSGNADATGMAIHARLWSFSWQFDLIELRDNAPFLSVSNHSYGITLGWYENVDCPNLPMWIGGADNYEDPAFGKYGRAASDVDALVRETDLVVVWTAGNERADVGAAANEPHYHYPSCEVIYEDTHAQEALVGYDTIGGAATAKNIITVGSVADIADRPFQASDIRPFNYSSYGPMDDGRVKPELVASGGELYSTSFLNDGAYSVYRGSSASAPVVAGGVALLVQKYRRENQGRDPRAAEIRALLVHTAVEAGDKPGPDYRMGFGLFDARAVAELLDKDGAQPDTAKQIRVAVLEDGQSEEFKTADSIDSGTRLRVTLGWTDPEGAPNSGPVDDSTATLANDLDLVLIAPDGETLFYPWSLDATKPDKAATRSARNPVDNLETVDVDSSDNIWDGRWTISVNINRPLWRGKPQAFAVVSDAPLTSPQNSVISAPRQVAIVAEIEEETASVWVPLANLGGGTLSWEVSEDIPWLSVSPSRGTAPDGFELIADTSVLEENSEQLGVIRLKSNDPSGDRAIGVLLYPSCEPDCTATQCGPDPVCAKPCGRCGSNEYCDQQGQCRALTPGCPSADISGQIGAALISGTTLESGNELNGRCGGDSSDERAFAWTTPESGWYTFSTWGSAFDTVIYLLEADCEGAELGCNDDAYGRTSALSVALQAGERVIAVVDGAAAFDEGDFVLNINKTRCPDGDIGSRLGSFVISPSDLEGIDVLAGSCGGAEAPDAALSWTAPQEGSYTFSISGPESIEDNFIYILEETCQGDEIACDRQSVEVRLERDERVVIVIDGLDDSDSEREGIKLSIASAAFSCKGFCGSTPNQGLCYCDAICLALEDCCMDVCDECELCESGQECSSDQCQPDLCAEIACDICQVCQAGSCVADENETSCDDGDPCTENDLCLDGMCLGVPRECDDGDPCTSDSCDPATGQCRFLPQTCRMDGSLSENPDAGPDAEIFKGEIIEEREHGEKSDSGCGCRIAQRRRENAEAILWILLTLVALTARCKIRPFLRGSGFSRKI